MQDRIVQYRVHGVGEIPAPGEALPCCLRPAVVEGEQHRESYRNQGPDEVKPGEALQNPRMTPRVPPAPAGSATGRLPGLFGGRRADSRCAHTASRDVRLVATT